MKRQYCTALLVGMLIMCASVPSVVKSSNINITVTKFSENRDTVEFLFGNPGSKKDDCIALQTGLVINNATVSISGKPYPEGSLNYPVDPWIDIGDDGIEEWRYSGEGYGMMGRQVVFSDNSSSVRMNIDSSLQNDSLKLRFPKGCTIVGGTIDVTPIAWSGILSIKFDISADGVSEWSINNLTKTAHIGDIASAIEAYVSSAQPTGGDEYVKYVDVPIMVTSNITCTIEFTNISIIYLYNPSISIKDAIQKSLPDTVGEDIVRISVRVGCSGPGKVLLHSLRIDAEPPLHKPTIFNISPAEKEPRVNESESIVFSAEWRDIYGNPCTAQWYLDGSKVGKENDTVYVYSPDYESSGKHVIEVAVSNGLDENKVTWNVNVINVNRAPVITDWYPKSNPRIWEGSELTFNVTAHDPDGTTPKFRWFFDDKDLPGEDKSEYTYHADYESSGKHTLLCEVYDGEGGSANVSWEISVRNKNRAPVIASYNPKEKDVDVYEGETLKFETRANDPDGDVVEYQYILDADIISNDDSANYTPSYDDAGEHTLTVIVSDGMLSTSHEWFIHVKDKNRMPVAVIKSPSTSILYAEYENITLDATGSYDPDGDNLSYIWILDGSSISEKKTADVRIPRGNHTLSLEVSDGRGGKATAEIYVNVGFVDLKISMKLPSEINEGDSCAVKCTVENLGNLNAENVRISFLVDDKVKKEKKISVSAGGKEDVEFKWTAEAGAHKIKVSCEGKWGTNEKLKEVNVKKKFPLAVIIALVIIGIAIIPSILIIKRKKKPVARPAYRPPPAIPPPPQQQPPVRPSPLPAPTGQTQTPPPSSPPPPVSPVPAMPEKEEVSEKPVEREESERAEAERKMELKTSFEGHAPKPVDEDLTVGRKAIEIDVGPSESEAKEGTEKVEMESAKDVKIEEEKAESEEIEEKDVETPEPPEKKSKKEEAEELMEEAKRMVADAESKGLKTLIAKRALDLSMSFYKTENYLKSIQYAKKAQKFLREEMEKLSVEGSTCPECGEEVEKDWRVCPSCGKRL